MQIFRSISSCVCNIIQLMGRCLGCCTKPQFVTTNNKPHDTNNNNNNANNNNNNKPSILEDFYSSSTYDMDSLPNSQITATSFTNLLQDTQSTSSTNPSDFINHGLLLWNQTRQEWTGEKVVGKNKKDREPVINWAIRWNATYDNLLGSNKPFAKPIPLPEMVNFLVDIWEQEGLYD